MSLAIDNKMNLPRISAGLVIRKITSYLYSELMRMIKDLAPQTNIENKRNTINNLIREFHKIVKRLHKFIKNLKFFENLNKLDKLSTYIFDFNGRTIGVMDQLFYTHEMNIFYRTPTFNMKESTKVINNNSHVSLKKNIASVLYNNMLQEKKDRIFYLTEKFFYNENFIEKEKNHILEKMKKDCAFLLNLNKNLSTLQNFENNETAYYKDGQMIFKFGEISFKLVFFNFQKENSEYFSYFCTDILLSNNQKYFIKTNETIKNFLNYLNNDVLFPNIQIQIFLNQEEKNFELRLDQLQNLLRDFTQKYVNRELFKQIKISIKDYITKKLLLSTLIKSNTKNEISVYLNYDLKTEEFFINLNMAKREISEGFFLNCSHVVVNQSPLIFAKNFSRFFNFNQIGKINFEKLICEKIKEFENIHLFLIYEKCKQIKSFFFPFKFEMNENNAKINLFYNTNSQKFLLFSLFNDVKGNLQIVDENFFLKTNLKHKEELKKFMLDFIKNQNVNFFSFNEILFENFFYSCYELNGFHVRYEKFNPINNLVILKFLINENKAVNRKSFLFIELNLLRNQKFIYEEISLNIFENSYPDEKIVNKLNLGDEWFYNILKTEKRKIEKFDDNIFKRITTLIKMIEIQFEEFLVGLTEVFNFSKNFQIVDLGSSNNSKLSDLLEGSFKAPIIVIPIKDNLEFLSNYVEKDNVDLLKFYMRDITIHNKNLIIKINLIEENLSTKFPQNMNNFSIFDTDNIIYYNTKEKSINFYFLTKMNVKNTVDFNYFKRFFSKILNKLINFIKKMSNFLLQNETKEILSHSENVLISPIGLQFKYNFFEYSNKTILIHFVNYVNSDKKNLKCLILPLEYHHHSLFSFDLLLKSIHECDENGLLSSLKYFIFLSSIYHKISNRFSTFIFPIAKNTYELINRQYKVFVFLKDYKTFHIIVHNKLSIFIEVTSINTILIYSSYLWNVDNCLRFMDSIINSHEIVMKSNIDNRVNTQIGVKKLIILSNDPVNLLKDINKILNYIDKFE